jgi:uridylate kinase
MPLSGTPRTRATKASAVKASAAATRQRKAAAAATRYTEISYLQVLERQLKVMDATAISLCMDNKLPIVVFDLKRPGNVGRVVRGEPVGTKVGSLRSDEVTK